MDKIKKLELLQQPELGLITCTSPSEINEMLTKSLRRSARNKKELEIGNEDIYINPWDDEPQEELLNKEIKKEILGTWYLINVGGDVFITKEKPKGKDDGFRVDGHISGYMQLISRKGHKFDNCKFNVPTWNLCSKDFNSLDLPEVTEENSPLEIEIMKSGNVYFYES